MRNEKRPGRTSAGRVRVLGLFPAMEPNAILSIDDLEACTRNDLLTAAMRPGRMHVTVGFNEQLAHRIEAGADCFLMPSRFEPCGLNQMCSQAYGTPPLVANTGGLADLHEVSREV